MSGKHPGSNDELVVTVKLPETKQKDIELNVTDDRVRAYFKSKLI